MTFLLVIKDFVADHDVRFLINKLMLLYTFFEVG